MRLFVAAKTTESNAAALARAGALLAGEGGFKPVPARQIHLTVKFLGEIADDRVAALSADLSAALGGARRFPMAPGGLVFFPDAARPRVAACPLEGADDALAALHRAVEAAAGRHGVAPDGRPFRPHLTIGRFKAPVRREALERARARFAAEIAPALAPHPADALELVRSVLKPAGPEYDAVAAFPLT